MGVTSRVELKNRNAPPPRPSLTNAGSCAPPWEAWLPHIIYEQTFTLSSGVAHPNPGDARD